MRQKHSEGTKQQIEKKRGIRVHEELKKAKSTVRSQTSSQYSQPLQATPISNPSELQARLQLPPERVETAPE